MACRENNADTSRLPVRVKVRGSLQRKNAKTTKLFTKAGITAWIGARRSCPKSSHFSNNNDAVALVRLSPRTAKPLTASHRQNMNVTLHVRTRSTHLAFVNQKAAVNLAARSNTIQTITRQPVATTKLQ